MVKYFELAWDLGTRSSNLMKKISSILQQQSKSKFISGAALKERDQNIIWPL